jgi:hypothetical protein
MAIPERRSVFIISARVQDRWLEGSSSSASAGNTCFFSRSSIRRGSCCVCINRSLGLFIRIRREFFVMRRRGCPSHAPDAHKIGNKRLRGAVCFMLARIPPLGMSSPILATRTEHEQAHRHRRGYRRDESRRLSRCIGDAVWTRLLYGHGACRSCRGCPTHPRSKKYATFSDPHVFTGGGACECLPACPRR